jgi:SpoIVB peptidase S55
MPLSQVHKGMKGYGVTVFEGTRLERFDVEILGVLNHIAPGQDLILARVDSAVVRRAGVIAGMSGSPIYIDDKVIGALAYSWNFSKEPIAGITPIDEMLQMDRAGAGALSPTTGGAAPVQSAVQFLNTLASATPEALVAMEASLFHERTSSAITNASPLAVPLSMSSFDAGTISRFGKYLDGMGFMAVPSGTTSTSKALPSGQKGKAVFAPGDAIAGVLLDGDFTVAATGTVTFVDGDRVYAFGHPFLDMGAISFPMAKSEVVTVMPSLASSFKFANTGETVGALKQDRATGIMGYVGATADTIPVELTVDGSGAPQTYRVRMVRHTQLSPLLLAMAADSVVSNVQRAAGERTVMLDSEIKVEGFAPIHLREGWAGTQARQAIPAYLALVANYLMSNEFQSAPLESVKLHLRHNDELKTAKIVEASVVTPDRGEIHPGDTVTVRTILKPFRGEEFTETFNVVIPETQEPGSAYLLVGSGSVLNQVDFGLVPPDPRTLGQVLAVLQRLESSTDLTVGFYSSSDGAVTAGVYLPNLPPSMRAVVTDDSSNRAQAVVKYDTPPHMTRSMPYIIDGAVKLDVDVKARM